jgi:voltage-gated potassium channel Kch
MPYFSLTTLTTTGYGDIVPIDPFARSLANMESVIGRFYLAITVARLVTFEMEHRSR